MDGFVFHIDSIACISEVMCMYKGTTFAKLKMTSAVNPELSKVYSSTHGVGQNVAFAYFACCQRFCLSAAVPVYSASSVPISHPSSSDVS